MDSIAQIEVKLINNVMDLKEELGRLEMEQWENDDSLNLIPKEANKHFMMTSSLRNEFNNFLSGFTFF